MMSDPNSDRPDRRKIILLLMQGLIVGIGAILPGISGGVLMVVFGLYGPMMETLASPKKGMERYWRVFLPVLAGWAVGFFLLAGVLSVLLEKQAAIFTSLFAGLILGTLPSLFRSGRALGPKRREWTALSLSALLLLAFFFIMKFKLVSHAVTPSALWFVFAGALWGVSLVAPGMTSSSVLLLLGLLQPLTEGLARFQPGVILPFIAGIGASILLLSRLVNYLLQHHYSVFYYCIIGFVIASTLPTIPLRFAGPTEAILSVLALFGGVVLSLALERISGAGKPAGAPLADSDGK